MVNFGFLLDFLILSFVQMSNFVNSKNILVLKHLLILFVTFKRGEGVGQVDEFLLLFGSVFFGVGEGFLFVYLDGHHLFLF